MNGWYLDAAGEYASILINGVRISILKTGKRYTIYARLNKADTFNTCFGSVEADTIECAIEGLKIDTVIAKALKSRF